MAARKSIFITGGGSGIGRAIAQRFAREGWFVGISDVDQAGMDATAALIQDCPSFSYRFDVCDPEGWDAALAAFAEASGGRINVVANNAGVPLGGALHELSHEEIDRTLAINLTGVIYGARAAYPYLKAAAPDACLINTSSSAAYHGQAGMTVYCASKSGVRAITESLDIEWSGDAIRVCDVMPGFIDTPLLSHTSNAASNVSVRDRVVATGLEITPVEEVAETFWRAAQGGKVHNPVGKTAHTLARASRWAPSYIRHRARKLLAAGLRPMG